ncbi:MAG: DUF2782 domain-containing protein [Pseudomonadota bacterium]
MRRLLLLTLLTVCVTAYAQESQPSKPSNLQPLPDAPPPPTIQSDPGLEPQVTITQKNGAKVEEYRMRGKLYAMKVTPAVGPAYYLIDERGDGQFIRRDNMDTGLRVPNWVILTF